MDKVLVAIMMGSKNDMPVVDETAKLLKDFGVGHELKVLSAHRTPRQTAEYAEALAGRGVKVVICAAGGSAALAGTVSAHTHLPVIGIPLDSMGFNGLDALLSTVQMPPGVPVAGVGVGKPGAKNAALIAVRILALSDASLTRKLEDYAKEQAERILKNL
ncbi:MAG: 5-(carboxyamino)imidazole ribonucleotide mutase [Candidatus Omnitrophica bacterium]|nr:5-(carboxyamino)imidazole ribonucleotide mutase [Candidatus Omnitrophota bacterium]